MTTMSYRFRALKSAASWGGERLKASSISALRTLRAFSQVSREKAGIKSIQGSSLPIPQHDRLEANSFASNSTSLVLFPASHVEQQDPRAFPALGFRSLDVLPELERSHVGRERDLETVTRSRW